MAPRTVVKYVPVEKKNYVRNASVDLAKYYQNNHSVADVSHKERTLRNNFGNGHITRWIGAMEGQTLYQDSFSHSASPIKRHKIGDYKTSMVGKMLPNVV